LYNLQGIADQIKNRKNSGWRNSGRREKKEGRTKMVQIGRMNRLTVKRTRDYGAQLDGGESGDILLPRRYVPRDCRPGDTVEVFVFAEGENRLRATTRKPYAMVGQFEALRVKANAASGAFLDWGLEKDLLVPKREQHAGMEEGGTYVVYVFLDEKTNRITASAKLDRFLNLRPPEYGEGEEVDLLICSKTDLGYKAIVNNSHWGMIYKNEVFTDLHTGRQIKGYIKKIRPDGKIDLSLQRPGYEKIDAVSRAILKTIQKHGGRIAVTDKTPPEKIYALFGVSKKTFKKALGALYKKKLVTLNANGIKLAER
jgi:predicted RNA-binding protein (virulence factor B family)